MQPANWFGGEIDELHLASPGRRENVGVFSSQTPSTCKGSEQPFTAWSGLQNEFGGRLGVEGSLDSICDTVERASAHSTAGFRNRHNDCKVLTAGFLFCPEAQFSEDDRLSQGLYSCVAGGRHYLVMHKYKQAVTLVTQTSTGFCGLRLAAMSTVVNRVEDFISQLAIVMVERSPLNVLRFQSIPMVNQFLPGFFQTRANFGRNTTAIDHCLKVAQQVSPAELAAVIGQMVVGLIAIADHNAIEIITQQVMNLVTGTRRPHIQQRRHLPNDGPQPGLVTVLAPACFVDIQGSGISNVRHYVVVSRLESLASDALQTADLSVSYFQLIQVLKYSRDHSLAESPKTTQQCDDRHDSRPKAPAWHGRWQLSSTAMPAVRTLRRMDLVFRENVLNRWEVRDLVAFGIRASPLSFAPQSLHAPGR